MKKNIFTLLFGLLLAVGWTNVASAQSASIKLADITDWTYTWGDASGNAQTSYYVNQETGKIEEVTDAYQIYGLLKAVYTNPAFPGPYYSAYTASGQREDPVYYGGIDGGWNIPYTSGSSGPAYQPVGDITISVASWDESFHSITVYDANTNAVLTSWNADNGATEEVSTSSGTGINYVMPTGWSTTSTYFLQWDVNGTACAYMNTNGAATLTISSSALNGATSVRVVINAVSEATTAGTVTVNGQSKSLASSFADYTWNINGAPVVSGSTTPTDVIIRLSVNTFISNITVTSGNTTITRWRGNYEGANLPSGWYASGTLTSAATGIYSVGGSGVIRIPASMFEGYNSVTVSITGLRYSTDYTGAVWLANTGDDGRSYLTSTSTYSQSTISSTINFPAKVNENTYKPATEGYTVLLVQVNNNGSIYPEPEAYFGAFEFNDSTSLINYIRANIKSVQLLTDGMRIGSGEDAGTVFNCSGTYNKFFFLGKGQARKKSSGVLASIGLTSSLGWPSYACEQGPFKFMFEQFSPTGGNEGEQITDFYIEMMDGAVYDVVHDCASVIQQAHQFSMSGNNGTQDYAMSGMNFFVPDYRLKYWTLNDTIGTYGDGSAWIETVDGRDMNPYMVANANGKTGVAYWDASYFAVNYAQYNPQHAPKVGLYTLALDAEAYPVDGYDIETNANYTVTLDWTSSLNEMSGSTVPQTYEIYEVTYVDGVETLVYIATVTNDTHYTFPEPFPQGDHSETHTYIIKGTPTTSTHPEFVAWSNEDAVVIPGLEDFLALGLDHYESDFDVPNVKNWYRNFLTVGNEDSENGLTYDRIDGGEDLYTLYRYDYNNPEPKIPVADILFSANSNHTVDYIIDYKNQDIEPDENNKYELENMGIPVEGTLTVKAAGDIVIQPNGYDVNFLSIRVQAGSYNQTWNSSQTSLPNGWILSDGSMWVLEEGAYYLEGGYILIPASVLGSYSSARVTINGYGDPGKVAKITVNGTTHTLYNGVNNAQDYVFNVAGSRGNKAPARAIDAPFTPETALHSLVNNGSLKAPNRVVESHTYTYTLTNSNAFSTSGGTAALGDVNWTYSSFTFKGYEATRGMQIGSRQSPTSTFTLSTSAIPGTIKSIIVGANAYSSNATIRATVGGAAFGTTQNLSSGSSAATNTFTGSASGDIVITWTNASSGGRAMYFKSITVVYETGSEDPDGQVTIGDGTSRINVYLPVYGSEYGSAQLNQMIYPADLLSAIPVGNQITSLTFYPTSYSNVSGLNFSGGKVKLSLGNTTISAFATTDAITPDDLTQVAEINNVTANSSMTAWTFTFDTPFIYEGGNLLVQIETEAGTAGETYFASSLSFGDYVGLLQGYGRADFLPKATFTYEEASVIPPTPSGDGLVRLDLQLVDQFSVDIPATNDHPRRYGYVLRYEPSEGDSKESGAAEVPVQHTGARVDGFYTIQEMLGDTDPDNFLTEDVLSAEVNMTLSGSSAPYFYTINSKQGAAPADAWHNYVSVLQRRELGDYQEMNNPSSYTNPYLGDIYPAGSHEFFDFRKVVAESKDDYLTYVPIIWTKGIDRRYYVEDSLHNSYGAPIWEVHPGDVMINNSVVQRQARQDATGNWIWNNSVNYTLDGTDYSLYFAEVTATGVLPQNTGIEYEPYMFRVWLVDDTESLRDYTWTYNDDNEPLHIDDAGAIPGAWKLLDTYMCDGADDLVYSKSITTDYANNLQFVAPIENFHPIIMVRFYFKVKGAAAPTPSGMRGQGEDNVGHVAIKGTNPHDPSTAVAELYINGEVVSKTYYNVQGMESDQPFDGINIVVTRYSNGATTTTKVRH